MAVKLVVTCSLAMVEGKTLVPPDACDAVGAAVVVVAVVGIGIVTPDSLSYHRDKHK